jgi:hypothetical protein
LSWTHPFDSPIPTKGKPIVTLKQAADYIKRLPRSEHETPHWQAATEALIMAAEGRGPMMHAEIGMLRAINAGTEREFRQRRGVKAYKMVR